MRSSTTSANRITAATRAAIAGIALTLALSCPGLCPTSAAQPATTFPGDGTFRVGVDMQPGTYVTQGSSAGHVCQWFHYDGDGHVIEFHGFGDPGQTYVTLAPADGNFRTSSCQPWNLAWATAPSPPQTPICWSSSNTTCPLRRSALSDTDAQGFLSYPDARCDHGDSAALVARTTRSVLAICRWGGTALYYKAVHLSDGARFWFDAVPVLNAGPVATGIDATNHANGTLYQVRNDGLTIVIGGQVAAFEPMVEYAVF